MRGLSRQGRERVLHVGPVALVALAGLIWIFLHAESGRGQTHTLFQILALTENVVALLLRRIKPAGTLASILVVYLLVDLEPVTALPVLLALLTLAMVGSRRVVAVGAIATAVIVVSMPYIHGDHATVAAGVLRASAVGCTVAVGRYLRARRERANAAPRLPHEQELVLTR